MDSRQAFEAWINSSPSKYGLELTGGEYKRHAIQLAWKAWQEAERRADVERAYYEAANRDLNLRILQLEQDCKVFARETAAANLRASTLKQETAA